MAHARAELARWQRDYNTVRPHSKLGGKTPAEIAGQRVRGHAPGHVAINSNNQHEVICSQKTGSFEVGVFRAKLPWLGGVESDEGIEFFGRAEGVYFEARG